MVARVTLLLTGAMAIALVPTSIVLIRVLLPAFEQSLPPLFVILPGVVALSQTKVVSSYLAGLGLTAITSYANVGSLVVNVVANLVLIPAFGIVGAAAASLISYSLSALVLSAVAARLNARLGGGISGFRAYRISISPSIPASGWLGGCWAG